MHKVKKKLLLVVAALAMAVMGVAGSSTAHAYTGFGWAQPSPLESCSDDPWEFLNWDYTLNNPVCWPVFQGGQRAEVHIACAYRTAFGNYAFADIVWPGVSTQYGRLVWDQNIVTTAYGTGIPPGVPDC